MDKTNERQELASEIASEVAKMMIERHDITCPHGYTAELREELSTVIKEWHDVAPRLNSLAETAQELVKVASLYKQGNAAIKAGIWGAFIIGSGTIVAIGIWEWVKRLGPAVIAIASIITLLLLYS